MYNLYEIYKRSVLPYYLYNSISLYMKILELVRDFQGGLLGFRRLHHPLQLANQEAINSCFVLVCDYSLILTHDSTGDWMQDRQSYGKRLTSRPFSWHSMGYLFHFNQFILHEFLLSPVVDNQTFKLSCVIVGPLLFIVVVSSC